MFLVLTHNVSRFNKYNKRTAVHDTNQKDRFFCVCLDHTNTPNIRYRSEGERQKGLFDTVAAYKQNTPFSIPVEYTQE